MDTPGRKAKMVDSKNKYYLRKKQLGSRSVIESLLSKYDFAYSSVFMIFDFMGGYPVAYYYSDRPDLLSKDLLSNQVGSLCKKNRWEF